MVNRLAGEQAALDAARQIDTRLARLTAEAEGLCRLLTPSPGTSEAPPIPSSWISRISVWPSQFIDTVTQVARACLTALVSASAVRK